MSTVSCSYGLVSMGGFMTFWGVLFLVATIAVALLKTEKPVEDGVWLYAH